MGYRYYFGWETRLSGVWWEKYKHLFAEISISEIKGDDGDISVNNSLIDGIWYRSDDTFNSSKMRDTLNLAKRTVLAVADGYFPKNPHNKYP